MKSSLHAETTPRLAITSITAQRRSPDRINIYVDGEFWCGAAYEVLAAEKLRVGSILSPRVQERLLEEDGKWKAKQSALSLLGVRARARGELSDRLRRKGYQDEAIAYAVSEAERLGLIDDRAFAESWVRDRIRLKPRGAHALVGELSRKRVPSEVAREAVHRVLKAEDVQEASLCMQSAAKWARARSAAPMNADQKLALKRKLTAFLSRRGFAMDDIRAAVRTSLPD